MPIATPCTWPGPGQPADLCRVALSGAMSFGTALRALRTGLGASQSSVAYVARLGSGHYSQIENNRVPAPPRPTALRIAAALRLPPELSERLAVLAEVERAAARTDAHLGPQVRALLRDIRLAAPRLTPAAVSRVRQALLECFE